MAKIGLNNFRYGIATVNPSTGAITYGAATKPGKAISFSFEPTKNDAKLYADDGLAETDTSVTGGTCTIGIDRYDQTTMAALLGHTVETGGEMVSNVDDVAPYVGLGRIVRIMVDNEQKFRVSFFALCKFSEPSESENTRGESVEFSTYELQGNVVIPVSGDWRKSKIFDTEEAATTYLEGLFR